MAIRSKDIYKGAKKKGKAGKVIAWLCILLVVLAIALFFTLRAFTIYDDAGNATIVSPFSAEFRQYKQAQREKAQASPSPSPEESLEPTQPASGTDVTDPGSDPAATDPAVTDPGTVDPTAPVGTAPAE